MGRNHILFGRGTSLPRRATPIGRGMPDRRCHGDDRSGDGQWDVNRAGICRTRAAPPGKLFARRAGLAGGNRGHPLGLPKSVSSTNGHGIPAPNRVTSQDNAGSPDSSDSVPFHDVALPVPPHSKLNSSPRLDPDERSPLPFARDRSHRREKSGWMPSPRALSLDHSCLASRQDHQERDTTFPADIHRLTKMLMAFSVLR